MKKASFFINATLSLVIVSIVLVVGYFLIYQPTSLDIRNWASGTTLETRLTSSSTTIKENQAVTVDIAINTKGKKYSGIQMEGVISGVNQDTSTLIVSQPSGLNPVFTEIVKDGDKLRFKFVDLATPPTAFTSNDSFVKLATLSLYPKNSTEDIKILLDKNKSGGQEFEKTFLSTSMGEVSYNVEIATAVGGTTAPPDQGIHRSCNEYCADSRECDDQYSCYYNRCRNPKNLIAENCSDPVVISKPVTTTTTTNTTTQQNTQKKGTTITPSPTPDDSPPMATVIITSASESTKVEPSPLAGTPVRVTPSPATITESTQSSTKNIVPVTSISSTPSPVPQAELPPTTSNNGLRSLLIIVAGLIGVGIIVVLIFIIRNIQSKQ